VERREVAWTCASKLRLKIVVVVRGIAEFDQPTGAAFTILDHVVPGVGGEREHGVDPLINGGLEKCLGATAGEDAS
jgi:hypothetical protein